MWWISTARESDVMSIRNAVPIIVLLGLLASCTTAREPIMSAETNKAPASLDWSNAQRINLVLDSFEFRPDHLTFDRGQPYRLHLENHSGSGHNLDAPEFFRTTALRSDATAERAIAAGGLVEVPPGGETDIYFVPAESGHFSFRCSHLLHETFGMVGDITVK